MQTMNEKNVFPFTDAMQKEHDLYLLKQAMFFVSEEQFALGPLDKSPGRLPQFPSYVIRERLTDTNDSYVLGRGDQQGETKLNKFGCLLGGRQYLATTFFLPGKPRNLYMLIQDLINALQLPEGTLVTDFLQQHQQLYPLETDDHDQLFLQQHKITGNSTDKVQYVTAKSVFMLFGASMVVDGTRVIDDYWEQTLKEQGFVPQHRVFQIPEHVLDLVKKLKPSIGDISTKKDEIFEPTWESPYPTVVEQSSWELRQEYSKERSNGQHLNIIVPGQTISGSLELSAQFKIPKYHSKNSFMQAVQMHSRDVPIGLHPTATITAHSPASTASNLVKPGKRLLNDIIDSATPNEFIKTDPYMSSNSDIVQQIESLNIDGWKFESLPVTEKDSVEESFSAKGLPLYDKNKLLNRLKMLTPNQIKELEHMHDSVYLNTGLDNARRVRKRRWLKYWQYKGGIPIGLRENQVSYFKDKHQLGVLEHVDVETVYNEAKNMDEVYTTKRLPNPNFLGHSNITGLKPPYVERR